MSARFLWSIGTLLVTLGLAALAVGWDTLLWLPKAAIEAARAEPWTYGLIAAGVALMLLATLIRRWRG
jgi:hypothetical protein